MLRKSFFITCLLMFALFAICLVSCDDDNDDSEATATITYEVGKPGPTGGIIFYDCDADNEDGNNADGLKSTECGWRYLEAAPADLRVVNHTPTVDSSAEGYSNADAGYAFGYYRPNEQAAKYVNGTTSYDSSNCTGTDIDTGKNNTKLLVDAMGTSAYLSSSGSITTTDYAARLCDILEYEKDGETYKDWFLPSKEELNLMYTNLKAKSLGAFESEWYWSSSENNGSVLFAWVKYFNDGANGNANRFQNYRVRPVRAFI